MHLRFLQRGSSEIQPEVASFTFIHDAGFRYHPGQPLRFDITAVHEHCDIILNHFSKALDNIAKRAPLTYERAWYTNADDPLILQAAERSERRLLAHVVRYTEAKYSVHLRAQQKQLDHLLRNGRTNTGLRRAMDMMPLPYVDLAILQYCHMLSSGCYLDDTTRNVNRLYGEVRFEDLAPLSDLPFPMGRLISCYKGESKPQKLDATRKKYATMPNLAPKLSEGPYKPKNFDFEPLNRRYKAADYLHWPEGGPLTDNQTRLLDEIPERMMCARCDRDFFFTKDRGETWFSVLEGESVLCRYCGCSNNLSTLKWMYLRDDMVSLHTAIQYFRNPYDTNKARSFPDILGRHALGPYHRRYAIDRVLRHSISEEGWTKIISTLKLNIGTDRDWDELIELVRTVDENLPSTNLHPRVVETDCSTFWQDLVRRYKKTLNHVTTVDFSASIANLRNFANDLNQLYELSQDGNVEIQVNYSKIPKVFNRFKSLPKIEPPTRSILPRGSTVKYEQFMKLKAKYPTKNLLPTIAIELLWRTHLLYPPHYHTWCLQNFGCLIEHPFDSIIDKSARVLEKRYRETAELWVKEYSTDYISTPTSWFHYFSTTNSYADGCMPRNQRTGLLTAQERKSRLPFWVQDHTDYVLSPTEETELYHTIFPTPRIRLLITTKLVLQSLISNRMSFNTMTDPKLSPLDDYLDLHWDESHSLYLSTIPRFPHLTHLVNNQVSTTILAVNLLFTYYTTPPTHISQIFQQKEPEQDDHLTVITKRLLMWLCVRHSKLFESRKAILPELMKTLHLRNIMRYRIEIPPADLLSARVLSFLEAHYTNTILEVVNQCEDLFREFIPDEAGGSGGAMPASPSPIKPENSRRAGMRDSFMDQQTLSSLRSSQYSHGTGNTGFVMIQRTGTWSTAGRSSSGLGNVI
ncbi:hypothetical protein H072_11518 [Dactylellina haptotyla CBS 200.50]|uniref:Uncharacterized protein n=1 Tax=Dactylellina haptotyla (strain CBS 200.50) TaxID=1284197 RepID=S7ZXL7_DACHA|nr:hypothetical protein H072_11518 [Dactylellina haptotyla CBS 200.50]